MSLPTTNFWGEFRRRHPAAADNIAGLCLQIVAIIVVIICAYYALSCKPFQSVSLLPAANADASHNELLAHRHRYGFHSLPVQISLSNIQSPKSSK
jgi:hypothetical protein